MSKRFAGLSIFLIATVFMPWFSVNAIITKISLPGYKLGVAGVLIVILGVIGLLSSQIKQIRFRGLMEMAIGILTLLFIWLSNHIFYSHLTDTLNQIAGGTQENGSAAVSQALGSTGFGFYIVLIVALLLVGFGSQVVFTRKTERLLPDKWNTEIFHSNLQQLRDAASETASTVEAHVKGTDWSWIKNWSWRTTRGKSLIGGLGLILIYIAALIWYNGAHSLYNATSSLLTAVTNKDTGSVQNLITTSDNKLSPGAIDGFVDYYSSHTDNLKDLLSGLNTDSPNASNTLSGLLNTSANEASSHKRNILGFVSYKIVLPTVELNLSGPDGSKYRIGNQTVTMPAYVLPASYDITDTVSSAFGPVTANLTEDTTRGPEIDDKFDFSNHMLNMDSNITGPATITINGKSEKETFATQDFGQNQVTIGPLPTEEGETVQAVASLPWGNWTESGQIQNGQCNLQSDAKSNNTILQSISKVIDGYNSGFVTDAKSGSYNNPKTLNFLLNNSPAYEHYTQQSGSQTSTYTKVDFSPDMKLVQLSDQNTGVEVTDSEYYKDAQGNSNEVDWTYDLEYNQAKSSWQIQNMSGSFSHVDPTTSNAIEITH